MRRWRLEWTALVAAFVIVLGASIVLYPHMASWFSQRQQSHVVEEMLANLEAPPNDDPVFRDAQIDEAHEYNSALAAGAIYEANAHIATGEGVADDDSFDYWSLLLANEQGAMGRLRYADLKIDLPIYHGTSDETLLTGVGHLQGTSLPVGGKDTRSVLTAHRGLPSATLFNELNKSKIGDTFAVSVLGEVLTYRVIEILVVEPDQTEAIRAVKGEDLMTLVTCTPLGVNTHRILVTGERITPTPTQDVNAANGPTGLPGFPWWAVIFGAVVIAAVGYVWNSGRPLQPKLGQPKNSPPTTS